MHISTYLYLSSSLATVPIDEPENLIGTREEEENEEDLSTTVADVFYAVT